MSFVCVSNIILFDVGFDEQKRRIAALAITDAFILISAGFAGIIRAIRHIQRSPAARRCFPNFFHNYYNDLRAI